MDYCNQDSRIVHDFTVDGYVKKLRIKLKGCFEISTLFNLPMEQAIDIILISEPRLKGVPETDPSSGQQIQGEN